MRVAIAHCILLSRAEKLLQRVLADGLQQLLTAAVAQLHEQRFFHQSGGQVSHLRGFCFCAAQMLFDGVLAVTCEKSWARSSAGALTAR
jgi:hypothetical protein